MDRQDVVRLFGMTNLMLESQLDAIEQRFDIDLGRETGRRKDKDEVYYPQFDEAIRREAAEMSVHYEIFYCLEKSIRQQIVERLEEEDPNGWWTSKVPPAVQETAKKNMARERDSGVTLRSDQPIDYINFGELGEVIKFNWDLFGDTFSSQKAVEKIMSHLNLLRGPIAHCSPLAEDEVIRLRLTLRDWFRLME
jgi:hypothetical protein